MIPRIIITPGEPAGIGPDITIHIAQLALPAELVVVADPALLQERAKQIDLPLQLLECDFNQIATPHQSGKLKIVPVTLNTQAKAGKLNLNHATYVIQTLETAATLCQQKKAHAIVTGPVHKGILNQAGIAFTGHTEFFANFCGASQTIMLFVVDKLKVALATTHLPLSQVSSAITKTHLQTVLVTLHNEIQKWFHLPSPRILVCGLNPHAGENGYLGCEEIDRMLPVIEKLQQQSYRITGPLPADTVFTQKQLQEADVVLAMYHDQALPLVKYLGFGHAVNLTLGLPFLRTSVDHGTAIDIAGTKAVDPGSMAAAIHLAIKHCIR
ncbi:MAG: 4-hydroxythreonine-4-phosphate dehydrogenase PdxA [Gammaproteobacteria bacterium RIFCSPHIGHO2_12_FULL_37_34]|nr:MAG: 4-hydroxythreonine-4-phosphate dehydrogenase PdxA [Gammaproteobacteria bacterium RIFCSPHIGHO2_12_FULL_37_34]